MAITRKRNKLRLSHHVTGYKRALPWRWPAGLCLQRSKPAKRPWICRNMERKPTSHWRHWQESPSYKAKADCHICQALKNTSIWYHDFEFASATHVCSHWSPESTALCEWSHYRNAVKTCVLWLQHYWEGVLNSYLYHYLCYLVHWSRRSMYIFQPHWAHPEICPHWLIILSRTFQSNEEYKYKALNPRTPILTFCVWVILRI